MSTMPPDLAELSREEKVALLLRLAKERAAGAGSVETAVQTAGAGGTVPGAASTAATQPPWIAAAESFPLAFAQQRFWFLDQLEPGSYADHIFRALRLEGRLDRGALDRALDELVRRHEALRTRFPAVGGDPLQVVDPPAGLAPPAGIPGIPGIPGVGGVAGVGGIPGTPHVDGVGGIAVPAAPLVDLSALAAVPRQRLAEEIAGEESRRPFDLARGPLFRVQLLRLAPRDHALLLAVHHIVCDGLSLAILLHELTVLYGAFAAGLPSPLPAPRARFGDFARAQREKLQGEALAQELAFWRERLDGAPAVLELPADHPRRRIASPRGAVIPFGIAGDLAADLKALARSAGATPFITLLALFDLLLFRYTGQDDLVVGVPSANRARTELEGVVGCFASTLLVRARIERELCFRQILLRVRQAVVQVFGHSDLPFEKLVEELQPARNLSHNPLFQVMFALQPGGAGALDMPGLRLSALPVSRRLAKLDLTLDMVERPDGFGGYFEYATDLFEAATIERLAAHFQRLVAAAVAAPERAAGDLPLLAAAERRELIHERNQPFRGAPPPVAERVAAQARRTPQAPAVLFGGEQLSYGELDRRANRLARLLRRLGVGAERSVGVCLERSLEMPMVLLAVLKSGGAWVPLDPEYPQERLALMIEDTSMPVLLTQAALAGRLPSFAGNAAPPRVLLLDRLDSLGAPPATPATPTPAALVPPAPPALDDDAEPDWETHPESLAYVVYTSGSTGRPKGVAVPHRAMANHVNACALRYGLGPADRVLQFTSISFDITSEEIFPTWLTGGAVVPRPPGLFPSFGELEALIARHGITAMDLPTAYWHEWVSEMHRAHRPPPAPLRLVVIGTEQALPERVADWLELAGDRVRLDNSYASTEATVTAVVYTPTPADLPRFRAGDRVPVGTTLHNCCAYVLDAGFEPAPVGVPGDIYIGGPNVSRGYANWPGRTAASFLPDPFAAALGYGGGQRMYRQGDVGRWLPGGDLEFLGRRDDQVKIRGFRVEPAEVSAVLARHPAVKDCLVVVRGDGPMGLRLVGYLTWAPQRAATVAELRAFLRQTLPEHMVPAALMPLAALPLTANGRVDQRALPAPAAERAESERDGAAPAGAAEEMLAAIWCEVLGIAGVGAGDHFFDLGGHSLLGTQVVSRVRERMGVELPLRALFESPTLRGLARCIEALRGSVPAAVAPPLSRVEREETLAVSFAQQRLWVLDRLEPETAAYNIPLALHLRGDLDPAALAAALGEVVRRHETLRTTFIAVDGLPRQVVHPAAPAPWSATPGPSLPAAGGAPALPLIDLAALGAEPRAAAARRRLGEEARRPFSLEGGPLLRTALLRLGADEHILLATLHHIVSDGWSLPIFVREVWTSYAAVVAGKAPALPELAVQYADFAAWQRSWLQGPVLAAELAHWRQSVAGLPPLLDLPLDRPRPTVRNGRGALHGASLGQPVSAALPAAARRLGVTPFMLVASGLAALLYRFGGQECLALGVPVAGRNRVEIESLIGFFVNTLVLRCDVNGDLAVPALVAAMRDRVLDADAHQDLPFEKLVEELAPERSRGHAPLFQVMLAYQNLPRQELTAAGLTLTPIAVASGTAKFDLTISVQADRGENVAVWAEYACELFDGATIRRLLESFGRLLEGLAAAPPERTVADLPLLAPAERHQLLNEWNPLLTAGNPAAATRPERETLHRLFEAQVDRSPDRPAVTEGGEAITYRELDERANRLAQYLVAAGVLPGGLVGLCFERSADLVVAVLAVLKTGAAYLPLDPSYPPERLAFSLEDSGVTVVAGAAASLAALPRRADRRLIAVDAEAAAIAACAGRRPVVPAAGELPAYVIYTSGSTGRPKGVVVTHAQAARLFSSTAPWFAFGPDDVWTLFHSYAFDLSVWEMWGAFLYGGRLVVVPYWDSRSPEAFLALLRSEQVTVLTQTPSAFWPLAAADAGALAGAPESAGSMTATPENGAGKAASGLALRWVIFAGEALDLSLLAPWIRRHGDARPRLVNMYGITETTVHVTYRPIRQSDLAAGCGSVIGVPIPDLTLHVVDRVLEPRPIGVPGEIVVGGAGLATGYLGRPRLTAQRFVPDPHGPAGARLYRSGDLARRLADGDLECLGRMDHQVKVRGFRVELGEIEAALGRHPAVAQAVVVLRQDAGEAQLVAYYVPAGQEPAAAPPDPAELRAALRQQLPEPMLPAWFVALPALPLTSNGKVDRRALPPPEDATDGAAAARARTPPAGPVQERIAAIWREVLRRNFVGAHDNFFELGGHSLLATQALSRLRAAFAVELPLRALFDHPTVAGLAEAVIQKELEEADGELLARLLGELESEPA